MGPARIVVSGIGSGCGKTTVATGLMGALSASGLKVQGFKVGPDFIDPSFHTAVTGRGSRNLDEWMLTESFIRKTFERNSGGCDLAVVEGVMGIFDGADKLPSGRGSTSHVARLLGAPVILVVDVWGMGSSAAAVVAGCFAIDPRLMVRGVVLNRVGSERHAEMCRKSIESATGVPVVGSLPRNQEIALPERHLGLVPMRERPEQAERLSRLSSFVGENVDIWKIVEIARSAKQLPGHAASSAGEKTAKSTARIGVAYDEAFNFYYPDALDALRTAGAELVYFSPIHDHAPPEVEGIYIGGGFPETHGLELERNLSMRSRIKAAAEDGMPIFAECGGMMYLTRSLEELSGARRQMVGLLDGKIQMKKKLTLGYTDALVSEANLLAREGDSLRGHEFHFSSLDEVRRDARFSYRLKRGVGIGDGRDGWLEYSTLAQYMHVHLASPRRHAQSFVAACTRYGRS